MPELTSESTAAVRRTLFCFPRLARLPAMIASQKNPGYTKVFSVLKRGGVFARFANHPYRAKDNLPLSEEK